MVGHKNPHIKDKNIYEGETKVEFYHITWWKSLTNPITQR